MRLGWSQAVGRNARAASRRSRTRCFGRRVRSAGLNSRAVPAQRGCAVRAPTAAARGVGLCQRPVDKLRLTAVAMRRDYREACHRAGHCGAPFYSYELAGMRAGPVRSSTGLNVRTDASGRRDRAASRRAAQARQRDECSGRGRRYLLARNQRYMAFLPLVPNAQGPDYAGHAASAVDETYRSRARVDLRYRLLATTRHYAAEQLERRRSLRRRRARSCP